MLFYLKGKSCHWHKWKRDNSFPFLKLNFIMFNIGYETISASFDDIDTNTEEEV